MEYLVTGSENIEFLMYFALRPLSNVERSSEDIENTPKKPWKNEEVMEILRIDKEHNMSDWDDGDTASNNEEISSESVEMVLVEVWEHHYKHCDRTDPVYKA
jgi:hypothetical protein